MHYQLTNTWCIPLLGTGTDHRLTRQRRDDVLADVSLRLSEWWPNAMAWDTLIRLHQVLDRRVKVTFALPASLNDVGAIQPMLVATCVAIHTSTIDGYPQPFLVIEQIERDDSPEAVSSALYVIDYEGIGTVIRVAEIAEIETLD
jgi:hypothetical protein